MSRMRRIGALSLASCALSLLVLVGCSGERELRCEPAERYQSARSVAPIRVPDDLSVPDESEALRIPPPPAETDSAAAREQCLEYPPDYFEGGLGA